MPLAVIMMICLILGAVMVLILGTTRQFKKRSEYKELKNRIKTLEGEKAQIETNIKTLEKEKADFTAKVDALEKERQALQDENTGFIEKVTKLEDKIKFQEEELTGKNQEIEMLKIQNIDKFRVEIADEGTIQIDNENSETESQ
jgi:septal ring factor EnvC (AmiA/AmiB activator)